MLTTSKEAPVKIEIPVRGSTKKAKKPERIKPLPSKAPIKLRLKVNQR